jgi:hypothetical protein
MGLLRTTRNIQEEKRKTVNAIRRSPTIQALRQTVHILSTDSQQFWQTNPGSWQLQPTWAAEKSTGGGRDSPVVTNLPIKVTSQGASSSGTPLQF